ncbi:YihY family inner membrane protein [bacterium]|nr:YihY family inner membrane protein [candidate division CSSED10-310 bacterium]
MHYSGFSIIKIHKEARAQINGTLKISVYRFLAGAFHVWKKFFGDHCFLRAAALAFTTILTLIPILILFFIFFKAFGGLDLIRFKLETFLFNHLLPESVVSIKDYIQDLVHGFNSKTVSTVSALFLILAAYGLFASIDASLNAIWEIKRSRSFFSRLINLWFIITVAPVLLGYSLYLSTQITDQDMLRNEAIAQVVRLLFWIMPTLLSGITLLLIFKNVPYTKVSWKSAAIGAGVAAILWEMTKYGFNVYVHAFPNYKLLYGSFMLLPLFLIWIDLSWLSILIGAEIAYVHQNFSKLISDYLTEIEHIDQHYPLSVYPALLFLKSIGERFSEGKQAIRSDELFNLTNLPVPIVLQYINRLMESGMIAQTKTNELILTKAPEYIPLNEVFDAFDDFTDRTVNQQNLSVLKQLGDFRKNTLTKMTLKNILAGENSA